MNISPREPVAHHDGRTIFLHWVTAALVASLWILGQSIDWFPKGDPRVYARSTHISLGAILAVVLVVRIVWRLRHATHFASPGPAWLDRVATLTHLLLYLLLVTTVALGVSNAWVRGDVVFNLFKIPPFAVADAATRESIGEWHALAANTLLALAFFHAAAALLHHFYWKDGVLLRMIPGMQPRR